jgi:hypothetical protein
METSPEVTEATTLDGNAAAGILQQAFGIEMTMVPFRCDHCGLGGQVAELRLFASAPGMVLRCPSCSGVVLRIVQTPRGTYLDAKGAAFLIFNA